MSTVPINPAMNSATPRVVPACPKRILVVDDDPAVRQVVAAVLQHAGHLVETADDGEAAFTERGCDCGDGVVEHYANGGLGSR